MASIHLIVPRRNCAGLIEWDSQSALSQTYQDLRVTIIDDASTDASRSVLEGIGRSLPSSSRASIVFNEQRQGVIANILHATRDDPPDTVAVLLDGDDALASPSAIERIAQEYTSNPETWLTYGSFLSYPERRVIYDGPYHPTCIHENHFRRWFWRCAPPRSFRVGLLRAVPGQYFRDDDGKHWELACDQGLILPMLELGRWHLKHIPDVLYFYNPWNWAEPSKERIDAQAAEVSRIRSRPELLALTERPW